MTDDDFTAKWKCLKKLQIILAPFYYFYYSSLITSILLLSYANWFHFLPVDLLMLLRG